MFLLFLFSLLLWLCRVSGLKSPSKLCIPMKSIMKKVSVGVASIGVATVVMTGGPDISIGTETWRTDLPSSAQQSFTSSSSLLLSKSSLSKLSTITPVSLPISLAVAANAPSSSIASSLSSDPSTPLSSPSSASKLEADVFSSLP